MIELLQCHPHQPTAMPPLLFVHGAWHGAWCWEEHFLPYFAEHGYDSYALSFRGHGDNRDRTRLRWTSLNDYVEDLRNAITRLPTPPVLIGHSMGGYVIQRYLEQGAAPAVVLLASTPPTGALRSTLATLARHPVAGLKANFTLSPSRLLATDRLCRDLLFSDTLSEHEVSLYRTRLQEESYRAILELCLPRLHPRRFPPHLPVLVLGGADDRLLTRHESRRTAVVYHAEHRILPGIAHDLMLDTRWQDAANEIRTWLDHTLQLPRHDANKPVGGSTDSPHRAAHRGHSALAVKDRSLTPSRGLKTDELGRGAEGK